jgi:hypothetical protein
LRYGPTGLKKGTISLHDGNLLDEAGEGRVLLHHGLAGLNQSRFAKRLYINSSRTLKNKAIRALRRSTVVVTDNQDISYKNKHNKFVFIGLQTQRPKHLGKSTPPPPPELLLNLPKMSKMTTGSFPSACEFMNRL